MRVHALAAVVFTGTLLLAPGATARPSAFSGKICSLLDSGALAAADISGPCTQFPSKKGILGTTWTANWGKQVIVGGADHFLGITVTRYSPRVFPRAWALAARPAAGSTQITTGKLREHYSVAAYDSLNSSVKNGAQGVLTAITHNGYGVTVALFDRPAAKSDVRAGLIVVTGRVVKVVLALN